MASATCLYSPKLTLILCLLQLFIFFSLSSASGFCNVNDRNTLLEIAKDLPITDWEPQTTPDCCNLWFLLCNSDGRVTSFMYYLNPPNEVASQIPSSIAGLPYLESLTLGGKVTGPIPDAISSLARLQKLVLNDGFTGHIPESLSRLQSLTYLDLSDNRLIGSIPPSLSQLTRLLYLDLSFNHLSGPIPDSLGRLTRLNWLDLHSNRLSGPIPPSLSQLSNITGSLDLRADRLTGAIPSTFRSFNNPENVPVHIPEPLSSPIPRSFSQAQVTLRPWTCQGTDLLEISRSCSEEVRRGWGFCTSTIIVSSLIYPVWSFLRV